MGNIRLIARLDIKGPNLVKAIRFEGLRVIGDPQVFARKYYEQGADELLYMDIVASLYGRNNLSDVVEKATKDVFIPITVGGGIRSTDDVKTLLRAGADKVAINTAAIQRPELIREVAQRFGSQCMVLSVEAKKLAPGKWEPYTENGREKTGLDLVDWVQRGVELGAGEVFITSVDKDGTKQGFDYELISAVAEKVNVPVIAAGGLGKAEDAARVIQSAPLDAICAGSALHYGNVSLKDLRAAAAGAGAKVREL